MNEMCHACKVGMLNMVASQLICDEWEVMCEGVQTRLVPGLVGYHLVVLVDMSCHYCTKDNGDSMHE